ncbi:E2F transcription factor-like E2FF [Picochlorum sp. SENEW3]|nr:E2F transcription factor-like E2FF [Picochlorum sp. SENEW3]
MDRSFGGGDNTEREASTQETTGVGFPKTQERSQSDREKDAVHVALEQAPFQEDEDAVSKHEQIAGGSGEVREHEEVVVTAQDLGLLPKREPKSALTRLCHDFLDKFGHVEPDGRPGSLVLSHAAAHCGVPRRRMYDVINVLEAIKVVKRVGKLQYEFLGYDGLPDVITEIMSETDPLHNPDINVSDAQMKDLNSLSNLTRRLIRTLLHAGGTASLSDCAAYLLGPGFVPETVKKNRTQRQITTERRLYDIGSILCSIGIIEKLNPHKRQPSFHWTYGWKPGDAHQPPELAVAKQAREPRPILEKLSEEDVLETSSSKRKKPAEAKSPEKSARMHTPTQQPQFSGMMPPGFNLEAADAEKFSNLMYNPALFNSMSMPMGMLPNTMPHSAEPIDPVQLDPSALAAFIAAQQNIDFSSHQSPGIPNDVAHGDFMMQFLPYMQQLISGTLDPSPAPEQRGKETDEQQPDYRTQDPS